MTRVLLLTLLLLAPAAAAAPPEAGTAQQTAANARRAATDLGLVIDPSKPMNIQADEFEAARAEGGGDVITFSRSVVATQEDMRLSSDWLEARYPKGGGNPERITARGSVRVTQPGTEIVCGELVYDSRACRITCSSDVGTAVVTRGQDVIKGREIEIDLCANKLRVRGRAAIELRPASERGAAEVGASGDEASE